MPPNQIESTASKNPSFRWIKTEAELKHLVTTCMSLPFVAIDTEFERTSTYFANAGLIQIASENDVWLVDPVSIESLVELAPLLEDASTVKVMHSMSEDVELLRHLTGVRPESVFDTQVAASFLGLGPSLGYQKLVFSIFDVELDKTETRSNWLQRPLTPKQVEYAVEDAIYLVRLYPELSKRLEQASLSEACFDECHFLIAQQNDAWDQPEVAYLKLRGAWSLKLQQQRTLQWLVVWRDKISMSENVPKPWVIADSPLIEFVANPSSSVSALYKLSGIKPKSVKRYGEALISERKRIIQRVSSEQASSFKLIDAPLKGRELDVYKLCKSFVSQVEKSSGLPSQLLASRRNLEQLVVCLYRRSESDLPLFFRGWRKEYLDAGLRKVVADFVEAK